VAKLEFAAAVDVECPPERAFDYFADHHHVAKVLGGVTRWEPIGVRREGVGARYRVELKAMGVPLRSTLRLDRWRRPHEIGWVSESGVVKQRGGFTFTPIPGGVHIALDIAYTPPASVLGAAIARTLDRAVRQQLQQALERIRDVLETDH